MTFRELRNTVVRLLHDTLDVPVVLSDSVQPEELYPYVVYSIGVPYSAGRFGDHSKRVEAFPDGETVVDSRKGHVEAVFSFTACSVDREIDGVWVSGEDEVEDLTERAVSWLLHGGYQSLMLAGVTVRDVLDVGNRSFLEIEDTVRQYGFDVRFGYARVDEAEQGAIEHTNFIKTKE